MYLPVFIPFQISELWIRDYETLSLSFFFIVFFHYIYPPYAFFHLHPRNHHSVVHAHESFFLCSIPLPSPHSELSACSLSMSLSPFSSLVQFAQWIPHMSEIRQYLSVSDWFISLSIMLSRSIHEGCISFSPLRLSSFPLCKCNIVVLLIY